MGGVSLKALDMKHEDAMISSTEIAVAVKRTPKEAFRTALAFLSSPLSTRKGGNGVVVKPSIYDPRLPGNTDVRIVRAVIDAFRDIGEVSVVESDNPIRTTEEAFSESGYASLAEMGVHLLNLSSAPLMDVEMPGYFFRKRRMPVLLGTPAFFVNLATLKTERGVTAVGAGIKNLFGLLPERDKSVYHQSIDSVLLDLLMTYRPDLTVVDLTQQVLGERESKATTDVGGVILGTDPVAVDAFCADLLRVDPLEIPYLRLASEAGMGEALLDRIRVRGTEHQKSELHRIFR
jgi:uncharacterized protein (DUF362 family)